MHSEQGLAIAGWQRLYTYRDNIQKYEAALQCFGRIHQGVRGVYAQHALVNTTENLMVFPLHCQHTPTYSLHTHTQDRGLGELVGRTRFASDEDTLVLEDEAARVQLQADVTLMSPGDLVTGVMMILVW